MHILILNVATQLGGEQKSETFIVMLLKTAICAIVLSIARGLDEIDSGEKHDGMPVGALLPHGPAQERFGYDEDEDSHHHHWDRRWETTVCATITVLEEALTSVTTMIPLVYTDLSILTTVATVSGCPKTTVLVVSGTTTTTASTTSTSLYITTSTASSLTATTTTVTLTSYTVTKPCCATRDPCGCNNPRPRQRSDTPMIRHEIEPLYSDDGHHCDDEWDF